MRYLSKTTVVLFFSCMVCVLCAHIKTPFLYYDEGFAVFNATRIINGEVPYKDFWTIYPPGQFYILAIIFKTFGTNLIVARVYDTMVRFVIVICSYLIAKKITSQTLALLVSAITTLLLGFADSYAYAVFPAMALSLLSILGMLQYTQTGLRRWALSAGLLIGMTTLFRWDIGLYTGISVALTILFSHFFQMTQESKPPAKELLKPSELLMTLSGAALLIIVPCYSYLIYRSGFSNLWTQAVIFPTTVLHEVRWLPYPSLIPSSLPFTLGVFPFIATNSEFSNWLRFYCTSGLIWHSVLRIQFFPSSKTYRFNCIFFWNNSAYHSGRYRYLLKRLADTITSMFYQARLSHSLWSFRLFAVEYELNIHNLVLRYYFVTAVIVLAVFYFLFPLRNFLILTKNFSPWGCYSRIDRAGCIYLSKEQEQAVEFIKLHTQVGESIFVGNRRHDLISINDVGFYFLSNRLSATKYHDLFPGVATTRPVQEEIVNDIKLKSLDWIVLVNFESREPNASAVSSGVHVLMTLFAPPMRQR